MASMKSLGASPIVQSFGAGRLYRRKPVRQHDAEDLDHLPVAVGHGAQLAAHPLERGGQHPVLEWRAVAQGAGLPGQDRNVMPWVIDGLAATEGPAMAADDTAILAQLDALGIGRGSAPGRSP